MLNNKTNIELLQKTVSGVLKRIEDELKKGDAKISPAGPNGDLAEQTGHADGETLQRADADQQGIPGQVDPVKKPEDEKKPEGSKDDKDDKGEGTPDVGATGSVGDGKDDDETMKAEAEVLGMLKGLIDENPDLLKGALISLLDDIGLFDEETSAADQGLQKTEEAIGGLGETLETLSKSLNDFISATNDRIASLSAHVEALSQRPIGSRKSVTGATPLMKGDEVQQAIGENPVEGLTKTEISERLLHLQREGVIRGNDVQMFVGAGVLTQNAIAALQRK